MKPYGVAYRPEQQPIFDVLARGIEAEEREAVRIEQERERLTRRLAYGGRKGRRAAQRLRALVTTSPEGKP